jgi:hypothetical protein
MHASYLNAKRMKELIDESWFHALDSFAVLFENLKRYI